MIETRTMRKLVGFLLGLLVPAAAFAPGRTVRPHAARLHVATRLNDGVDAAAPPIDVSTWFRDFNSFMDELDDDDDSVDVLDEAIPVVDAQPMASTMLSSETSTRRGTLRDGIAGDQEDGRKSVVRMPSEVERCEVGPWVGLRPKNQ